MVLRHIFQNFIPSLAFDSPADKSTPVSVQIYQIENDDEFFHISDIQSVRCTSHTINNNIFFFFFLTADNQFSGVKVRICAVRMYLIYGDIHSLAAVAQTDTVGGEINEAISSCTDSPYVYFRSGPAILS